MMEPLGVVSILSHRGGSGKSLIAASLACVTVSREINTLLLDLSPAGGSSSLGLNGFLTGKTPWSGDGAPQPFRLENGLYVLRATPAVLTGTPWKAIQDYKKDNEIGLTVIDTPTTSRAIQSKILTQSSLMLVVVPTDAGSLKSLLPFFEYLAEEKNRPNRFFHPMAVLSRVQTGSPQRQLLLEKAMAFLSPVLVQGVIPEDNVYTDVMASGRLPVKENLNPKTFGAIDNLAQQVLAKLSESIPTTVAGSR